MRESRNAGRAERRRHCVGAGAPVNFGRPRRGAGGQKSFSKIPEKISFYPKNFLMTYFSHVKLQQIKYTATMASAARRSTKIGGGDAHKLSSVAAARGSAYNSTLLM